MLCYDKQPIYFNIDGNLCGKLLHFVAQFNDSMATAGQTRKPVYKNFPIADLHTVTPFFGNHATLMLYFFVNVDMLYLLNLFSAVQRFLHRRILCRTSFYDCKFIASCKATVKLLLQKGLSFYGQFRRPCV